MPSPPIRLYWLDIKNLGDQLSPRIVERVLGRPVAWAAVEDAELVALGSVVEHILRRRWRRFLRRGREPISFWGTGFIKAGRERRLGSFRILALRGPQSAARFRLPAERLALGDPGILVADLFQPRELQAAGDSEVLLCPHVLEEDAEWVGLLASRLSAQRLSLASDVLTVLSAVRRAKLVVSSALHGLVVAHAFGVPAVWVAPEGPKLIGGAWKFLDYFSAFGAAPVPLSRDLATLRRTSRDDLHRLAQEHAVPSAMLAMRKQQLLDALKKAF